MLLRWCIPIVLALPGVVIAGLNWRVFYLRHLRHKQAGSWVPLVGGALLAGAAWMGPAEARRFWWVGLVLDWGSLPGLTYTAARLIGRRLARPGR